MDNVSCQTDFSAKHLTGMEEEWKKYEDTIKELKMALEKRIVTLSNSLKEMMTEYSTILDCQPTSHC